MDTNTKNTYTKACITVELLQAAITTSVALFPGVLWYALAPLRTHDQGLAEVKRTISRAIIPRADAAPLQGGSTPIVVGLLWGIAVGYTVGWTGGLALVWRSGKEAHW